MTALILDAATVELVVACGLSLLCRLLPRCGGPADHCLVTPGPHLCWIHQGGGGQPHDLASTILLERILGHLHL